jgi:phage terminase large subunit-like protein
MYKYYVEELGVKHLTIAAPSNNDLVNTIVRGESGVLNAYSDNDPNKPEYMPHYGVLKHKNGAVARLVSSESSERSRGINSEVLLSDEAAAWSGDALEFYHNLLYGLRLGISQGIIVTTPKATPLMIELKKQSEEEDSNVRIVTGSSFENSDNLSPQMLANAERTRKTKLGMQEVEGELILANDMAAWNPDLLDKCRATKMGEFHPKYWKKAVIGLDPAGESTSKASDETGIIVAVLTESDKILVVEDKTARMSGDTCIKTIHSLHSKYSNFCPTKVRIEANGIGGMYKSMIKREHPFLPMEEFSSVNKKYARAITCAQFYETGIVFHDTNADLGELENEMISFDGKGRSPNHVDALGFAVDGLIKNSNFTTRKQFIL